MKYLKRIWLCLLLFCAAQVDVYRTCKYYFPRYWSGEFDRNRWRFWIWGKE